MKNLSAIPGLPPLLATVGLLAAWEIAARVIDISGLPPAHEALRELPKILTDKESLLNILDSIRRMVIGFALALAFAVPVGLMMGRSRFVAAFFNPLLMIIYPVPKAALMPIIMLWLGVGDASKTLVIFLGVSLPVIYHSYQGARALEEKMLWSAAAMGMGARARLLRIVLPAALPEIVVGIRTGLVLALITMVTSEMIARKQGVGDILFNALAMAQYETVYATIVIIGMLGFIIDVGFERLRVGRAGTRDCGWLDMTSARRFSEIAVGILPIALVLALWQGIVASGIAPPVLLPAPGAVFARLIEQVGNRQFLENAAITLYRLFAGFSIAVVLGVTLGVAATGSKTIEGIVKPLVRVLAPLPKVALYPAMILILGFDDASKIALVAADAVFPILLATWQGTGAVEPKLVWSARAAGTSQRAALFKIVLMAALPSVLTGCRIGLIISCIVVFLAEMITSTDGLGYLMVRAARNFETVDMFVPLISISILGLTLNAAFNALRAWLLRGFPEER